MRISIIVTDCITGDVEGPLVGGRVLGAEVHYLMKDANNFLGESDRNIHCPVFDLLFARALSTDGEILLFTSSTNFKDDAARIVLDQFMERPDLPYCTDRQKNVVAINKQFLSFILRRISKIEDFDQLINGMENFCQAEDLDPGPPIQDIIVDPDALRPPKVEPTPKLNKKRPKEPLMIGGESNVNNPNAKRVFIGIPSDGGAVESNLVYQLLFWTHQENYLCTVYIAPRMHPLALARNNIVKAFLETDCEYLFWVDDDVVPPPHALDRLVSRDKYIVSAINFSATSKETQGYFIYPITLQENENGNYNMISTFDRGDLVKVDAVGGGCVLVKREVYEKVDPPWYFFDFNEDVTHTHSADFNFYKKANSRGYSTWVDNTVVADHLQKCSMAGLFEDKMRALTEANK